MKGTCVPFTLPIVGKSGGAPAGAQTPRRFTNGTADVNDTVVGLTTDRGYTEHEMLDELGIIHMNGRIYDPYIGRFMSADPYIQAPYELQSHNRFAYVMNNPLLYTDPSGYSWSFKKILRFAIVAIAVVVTSGAVAAYLAPATFAAGSGLIASTAAVAGASLGNAIIIGAAGGFVGGALGAAVNGASLGESLKAGIVGGITGAAFAGVGFTWGAGSFENYLGHAVVGCGSSLASGGGSDGCARGAASALIGKAVTNNTSGDNWNDFTRGVAATVSGGVTSCVMGGTFASGAQTTAYDYLFNRVLTNGYRLRAEVVLKLEEFNEFIGLEKDVVVTGGDRSSNSQLGAKAGSRHVVGDAADIKVPGQMHAETGQQAIASGLFGGVGVYLEGVSGPNGEGPHVHVDLRPLQNGNLTKWGYKPPFIRYKP